MIAGAGAGLELEVEVGEKPAIVEVDADPLGIDDGVAEPRGGRDDQVHVELLLGRGLGLDLVETIEAAARLRGARLDPGSHPLDLPAQECLALALARLLLLLTDRLGLEEVIVAALVGKELPGGELDDAVGDAVEEIAVVGHEEAGAAGADEELFEPGDRFDVEVVGRLVEDEQVWAGDDGAAEGDAAFLAAG